MEGYAKIAVAFSTNSVADVECCEQGVAVY